MKPYSWRLFISFTILSFIFLSKWWIVEMEGPIFFREMWGFPLPWLGFGALHTSLAHEIFLMELMIDLAFYIVLCYLLLRAFGKLFRTLKVSRLVKNGLLVISLFIAFFPAAFLMFNSDNTRHKKVDFEYEVIDSGWEFFQKKPDGY